MKILFIDDNEMDLLLAEEAFTSYQDEVLVDMKSSAAAALLHLQDEQNRLPDVIITDLNMPGMTGMDLIRVLKSDPRLRLIPVVVMSTSNHESDIHEAYSLHASSYLVKAQNFSTFVAQVERFLAFWKDVKVPNIRNEHSQHIP